MKLMALDWRGAPDLAAKVADLYSVGATVESRPVTGNPQGRVLVGISPTILLTPSGLIAPTKYNKALAEAAKMLGANFPDEPEGREVWRGTNNYSTVLFDLTKRGMLKAWLEILEQHFPWADGFHCDYASAWSWLFPDMASTDQKWDDLLQSFYTELRRRKKLVLTQQFHVTNPTLGGNGCFVEQSPYAFRYTLAAHDADMNLWTSLCHDRENIWTYEIREWQNWPKASLDLVKKWAEEQDVYLCLGRDGNVAP